MNNEGPTALKAPEPRSLKLLSLLFFLLILALHSLTYLYWSLDLNPKLRSEIAAHAAMLADAQSIAIAEAATDESRPQAALEETAARILLLARQPQGDVYFEGLKTEFDYFQLPQETGSLDRSWGTLASPNSFVTEVPLYSPLDSSLIGLATFYSGDGLARHISGDFRRSLIIQTSVGTLLLLAVWFSLRKLYRSIDIARAKAEAANKAKSSFLANMSHELRTPLNAIIGFTEIMERDSGLQHQDKRNLQIISRSGEHLLSLINSVLEMSKIEAGMVLIEPNPFDLRTMLESIESMMGMKADQKNLQLKFELPPDMPRSIRTDEGKLRQILINLLGNAVKFTPKGSVTLRVEVCACEDNTGADTIVRLRFYVADTGPGIPQAEQDTIFQAFRQAADNRQRSEGTGLGLAISRQYAVLMGGSLSLTSSPGQGSEFVLEIPVEIASEAESASNLHDKRRILGIASPPPDGDRWRILAVDDMEENRLLLRKILEPLGFEVQEAADGLQAQSLCQEWRPHFIWMDLRMPNCNGYEAMEAIRSKLGPAMLPGSPYIVALTAHAFEEERRDAFRRGFDDFVRKPFKENLILETLRQKLKLEYYYEDTATPLPQSQREQGRSEAAHWQRLCARLPSHYAEEFRQAIDLGDLQKLDSLIASIAQTDADLANHIGALVRSFAYDRVLALFDAPAKQ